MDDEALLATCASIDLNPVAAGLAAHIRSLRMFTGAVEWFAGEPRNDLLGDRSENEVYCAANPGRHYAVYFPDGGAVKMDVSVAEGPLKVRWLDIERSAWQDLVEHLDLMQSVGGNYVRNTMASREIKPELWERHDCYRTRDQAGWLRHPFNPDNNVNFTAEQSGLPTGEWTTDPGHPLFATAGPSKARTSSGATSSVVSPRRGSTGPGRGTASSASV